LAALAVAARRHLRHGNAAELPGGLEIRITNPKGMIILGRERRPDGTPALDAGQALDLEVIKRKYANVMDIMTYDDLLRHRYGRAP
jgi:hypothetical protein